MCSWLLEQRVLDMAKTRTIVISENEFSELNEDCGGICIACESRQYGGCEPDARNYPCEECGESKVFGVEELLIMGLIELDGDGE